MNSVHLKFLSSIFHLNFLCNILFDAIDRYYICKEKTQMRRLLSWILLKYLRHVNIYMINWNVCYLDVSFCLLYLLYYQLWFWWCRIMVKESQWHILGDWDTFLRFWRLTRCILFECSFLFLQCIDLCWIVTHRESEFVFHFFRVLLQIYIRSNRLADAENIQRKLLHMMELSKVWFCLT